MDLAYVHIIEPREDLSRTTEEKIQILTERAAKSGTNVEDWMSLAAFRRELGGVEGTRMFSAGTHGLDDPFDIVDSGKADAVVYGRYLSTFLISRSCATSLVFQLRARRALLGTWLHGHAIATITQETCANVVDGLFQIRICLDALKRVFH